MTPPDPRERPTMAETLRALELPQKRPYPEDGRPATRGFPMTRAQRVALELRKREGKR